MKIKELKEKSTKELQRLLYEKRKELQELIFKKNLGTLKKTHKIRQTKKTIARILTLISQNQKNEKTK